MSELVDFSHVYHWAEGEYLLHPISSGLLHTTWRVEVEGEPCAILQKINVQVFKHPNDIVFNLELLNKYLQVNNSSYSIMLPAFTKLGDRNWWQDENTCWRAFPFIKDSVTIERVTSVEEAYNAAYAFGHFTAQFQFFDATQLKVILPNFHDLSLRFRQFSDALQNGIEQRIQKFATILHDLQFFSWVSYYWESEINNKLPIRVIHHDTKISNVLFLRNSEDPVVIDLDTVMPGTIISDIGDMMRTYLSEENETSCNWEAIHARASYYTNIIEGYSKGMGGILTDAEINAIPMSGVILIWMQALRFGTDYLLGDPYYGASYPEQNFDRCKNQLHLLKSYIQMSDVQIAFNFWKSKYAL